MVGTTISHYEVVGKLGQGGMGMVWKAWDKRLNRLVALKVLADADSGDPEITHRLVQEALAISALNHPNIVTIHEVAQEQGAHCIVMEFVSGRTLKAVIGRRGLPVDVALRYGLQIADALGAAHQAGIVHRDLKPTNIMVTDTGSVKVLDFGLAQVARARASSPEERTLTAGREGVIAGTVTYMSPEQAGSQPADARSDIFSFGCVLYEMLSGRRPFGGDTAVATLGAIIHKEPKRLSEFRPNIPPEVERIVGRCLKKDPARRFQDVADLRVALEEVSEELADGTLIAPPAPQRLRRWGAAGLALLAISAILVWLRWRPEASLGPLRSIPLTSVQGRAMQPAISPDGNQVAFVWTGPNDDNYDIYVKPVGGAGALRLTTNPAPDQHPAWSRDGRSIAFVRNLAASAAIFTVSPLGGAERRLCEFAGTANALAWTPDGRSLVVGLRASQQEPFSLRAVSVESCDQQKLTSPPADMAGDSDPVISPDGRTLAFARQHYSVIGDIWLLPLAGGAATSQTRQLLAAGQWLTGLAWTPDGSSIIFSAYRDGSQTLWRYPAAARSGVPERVATVGEHVYQPSISLHGHRLVYQRHERDINIWRTAWPGSQTHAAPTRFTDSTLMDDSPQYSPDGHRVVFVSNRSGSYELWLADSEGRNPAQLTFFGGPHLGSPRWSPDGGWIAFDSVKYGNRDIYVVSPEGGIPHRLTTQNSANVRPSYSRDGRWIYFGSNRSGRWEIWKMPAQGGAAEQLTKEGGGHEAFESADGRYVYYEKIDSGSIWRAPAGGGHEELAVPPPVLRGHWALAADGVVILRPSMMRPALEFFRFSTSRREHMADLPQHVIPEWFSTPALALSPDHQWILYLQMDRNDTDVMLIENFR